MNQTQECGPMGKDSCLGCNASHWIQRKFVMAKMLSQSKRRGIFEGLKKFLQFHHFPTPMARVSKASPWTRMCRHWHCEGQECAPNAWRQANPAARKWLWKWKLAEVCGAQKSFVHNFPIEWHFLGHRDVGDFQQSIPIPLLFIRLFVNDQT